MERIKCDETRWSERVGEKKVELFKEGERIDWRSKRSVETNGAWGRIVEHANGAWGRRKGPANGAWGKRKEHANGAWGRRKGPENGAWGRRVERATGLRRKGNRKDKKWGLESSVSPGE